MCRVLNRVKSRLEGAEETSTKVEQGNQLSRVVVQDDLGDLLAALMARGGSSMYQVLVVMS
jgi:hypothetical protein